MSRYFDKIRLPAACLAFSLLVHILTMYGVRICGTCTFGHPVNLVVVDLAEPARTPAAVNAGEPERRAAVRDSDDRAEPKRHLPARGEAESRSAPEPDTRQTGPEPAAVSAADAGESAPVTKGAEATRVPATVRINAAPLPLRSGTFLAAGYEKLTYQISMFGIPVGSAELEAKNEDGDISIALRVRSNGALSSIYPVDDLVETRHIDGRFIMAKVRQQEGPLRNDVMFTINLGKKRVTWTDLIRGTSAQTTVPADVLDTLSGIYYLRNRPLEVGRTETLHIYDSETYAEVPVEILRREEMRLPNLRKVDTLVVRPLQKTAGIFRRTGDILIWMTDDDHRVPVKIVTTVPLGQVTAELLSADSKPHDQAIREISR